MRDARSTLHVLMQGVCGKRTPPARPIKICFDLACDNEHTTIAQTNGTGYILSTQRILPDLVQRIVQEMNCMLHMLIGKSFLTSIPDTGIEFGLSPASASNLMRCCILYSAPFGKVMRPGL